MESTPSFSIFILTKCYYVYIISLNGKKELIFVGKFKMYDNKRN